MYKNTEKWTNFTQKWCKMLSESNRKPRKRKSSKAKQAHMVKDHGNDPFFIKKAEESKAFLEKHGFPKELLSKK
jgi:hypothetical protein